MTAGFNGAWTIQSTGPNARYVERRLAGPGRLHYEFTGARPRVVRRALDFENAGHEDNYSMPLIVRWHPR